MTKQNKILEAACIKKNNGGIDLSIYSEIAGFYARLNLMLDKNNSAYPEILSEDENIPCRLVTIDLPGQRTGILFNSLGL